MKAKKQTNFFEAFAALPEDHKATMVLALRMYAQVMGNHFGSITFSPKELALDVLFDETARPLDPQKAHYFAKALSSL